jgi:hypothetical protein
MGTGMDQAAGGVWVRYNVGLDGVVRNCWWCLLQGPARSESDEIAVFSQLQVRCLREAWQLWLGCRGWQFDKKAR